MLLLIISDHITTLFWQKLTVKIVNHTYQSYTYSRLKEYFILLEIIACVQCFKHFYQICTKVWSLPACSSRFEDGFGLTSAFSDFLWEFFKIWVYYDLGHLSLSIKGLNDLLQTLFQTLICSQFNCNTSTGQQIFDLMN